VAQQVPLGKIVRLASDNFDILAPHDVLHLQRIVGNQVLIQCQLGRVSPDERKKAREQKREQESIKKIHKGADRKGRTRRAGKLKEKLKGKDKQELLRLALEEEGKNTPPTRLALTGKKLFSGSRNFDQAISDHRPQIARHRSHRGVVGHQLRG
jgi:hypothetical protein